MENENPSVMSREEEIEKLRELVNDVRICMFTTKDGSGEMSTRPFTTIDCDDDGNLWFFTNEFGENIVEESHGNEVSLIYAHPGVNTYVHVKGKTQVIVDRKKIEELWKPVLKAWFPDGVDDPKLCLIKVIPDEAKYWDAASSKMVSLFNILKAIVTHDKYKGGEVGTLHLMK